MPIGNVFRTLLLGLNLSEAGCKDGSPIPAGSLAGFGGPLLTLAIQSVAFLLLIVWLEGGMPRPCLGRTKAVPPRVGDVELTTMRPPADRADGVVGEATRAESAPSDLLRALHVSKTFGSNKGGR